MSRADFNEFIQRQAQVKAETPAFDAAKQLSEWQQLLAELYATIASFMRPYVESGQALLSYEDIRLIEDFSGPYFASQMTLKLGVSTVIFEPIGTMLIGSKGRVDVQGPRGKARLALMNRKTVSPHQMISVKVQIVDGRTPLLKPEAEPVREAPEWVWKIITSPPDVKFIELSEDNFFDMLLGIVDA